MVANRNCYVSNNGSANVSVIDAVTNAFVTNVAAGTNPGPLAMTPDGTKVYVTNTGTNTITSILTSTNTPTTITLAAGLAPVSVAVTPNGIYAVVLANDGANNCWAIVITVATDTILHSLQVTVTTGPAQTDPTTCLISPDSSTAYLSCFGAGQSVIVFYNIVANTVAHTIIDNTDGSSFGLALTSDNATLYAMQRNGTQIARIDVASATVTTHIVTTNGASFGIISPDGKFLLTSGSPDLYAIEVATNTVHRIVTTGGPIAIPAATKTTAYYGDFTAGANLQILNLSTFGLTTLNLASGTQYQAGLSVNGDKLYVADRSGNAVSVVSTATNTILATPGVGVNPQWLTAAFFPFVFPPPPPFPGGQFIPKLFIPIKGKIDEDYTVEELNTNWLAIENWSQRWVPLPTVPLKFPHKRSTLPAHLDANWVELQVWASVIKNLGAPYSPIIVPRKSSSDPTDLDTNWLRIQGWANRLPL